MTWIWKFIIWISDWIAMVSPDDSYSSLNVGRRLTPVIVPKKSVKEGRITEVTRHAYQKSGFIIVGTYL